MTIEQEIRKKWKPRKRTAHKGDFGRLLILAGSTGFTGAAHLAALGALRAGAGLLTLGVPEKIYPILARREADIMVRPFPSTRTGSLAVKSLKLILSFLDQQDVLAIGPGLSQNPETQKLIRKIIPENHLPIIIDADGLNALKGNTAVLYPCRTKAILTPHPGEFCRVFGGKLSASDSDRKKKAVAAAKKFGVFIVLKGHHTVVASPDGEIYVNKTGNPGMAKGGTGDVLTGMIAALVGQKFSLWDAARFGVYIHGLAADHAVQKLGEVSCTASDLLTFLPETIKKVR